MYHAKASKNTSRSTKSLQAINKATYSGTQLLHSTVGKLATKLQVRFTRTGFRSQDAFSFGTRFSTHVPSMHVDTRRNGTIPFSRCYFNYASAAARSGVVIVVSLGFFGRPLWSREISPILVSAVRAMSPLDDVSVSEEKAEGQECFSQETRLNRFTDFTFSFSNPYEQISQLSRTIFLLALVSPLVLWSFQNHSVFI